MKSSAPAFGELGLAVGVRGEEHDRQKSRARVSAQVAMHVRAGHPGQAEIEQHEVEPGITHHRDGSLTVGHLVADVAGIVEERTQRAARRLVVLHHQDACSHARRVGGRWSHPQ